MTAPTFFATPAAFRKWLAANHAKKTELLVGFYKTSSGKRSITWPESVDEALCFGWIDGVRKGRRHRVQGDPAVHRERAGVPAAPRPRALTAGPL